MMLLRLSSHQRLPVEDAVEVAGEVALRQPDGVSAGFPFGDATCDLVPGGGVVQSAVEDDGVEGAVELAVAAAAEPVPGRLSA